MDNATDNRGFDPFEEFTLGSGGHAILCIHGLGCAPVIYYEIATELAEAGYTVRAITLPGHGSTLENFAETPWTAWYDKVEREYAALAGKYDRVSVIGFSIGSMLGAKLASVQKLDRLVLIGPPYYIIRRWLPFRSLLKIVGGFTSKVPLLRMNRRFLTAGGWIRHTAPTVEYFPIPTLRTTSDMVNHVRPLFSKVGCPTQIIVSRCDLSADPHSGPVIMRLLNVKDKRLVRLSWSHHQILQGCQRDPARRRLREFFGA